MISTLKKGDVVKFRKAHSPEKEAARMVILIDPRGGSRVFVRDISDKKIANCINMNELELCEQGFQAHP